MAKAKIADLLPIPAIRQVLMTFQTTLEPLTHQVSAMPIESDLEYYFVSAEHMHLFSPYYRPGKPFKNLKLVNYGRPAISVSFYNKHKYHLERNTPPASAQAILQEQRDNLYARSFLESLSAKQQQKFQEMDSLLRAIRQAPDQFEFCVSNYDHYYRYWYCSFRYFEDDERTKTGTSNEHLLKHTQRTDERSKEQLVNERLNIIFIDPQYITRPVAYDNKLIDRELETYPDKIRFGKATLYIRSSE